MTTQAISRNAAEILATYQALATNPGADVSMLDLRSHLDQDDAQMREAVTELTNAGYDLYVEQEAKLRNLTRADHDAALQIGGQAKHWIAIVGR